MRAWILGKGRASAQRYVGEDQAGWNESIHVEMKPSEAEACELVALAGIVSSRTFLRAVPDFSIFAAMG